MVKSVFEVEAGDILSVYNRDFIAEQVFRLGSPGAATSNYLLKDGSEVKWFAARKKDSGETFCLGDEVSLKTDQPGENLFVEGTGYSLVNRVQGRTTGTSAMGYPRFINMEYFDYAAESGDRFLFVQKSDRGLVAFTGEPVISSALMVFPKPK